jgi:hypothetical protein
MNALKRFLKLQSPQAARRAMPLEQSVDCQCADPRLSTPVAVYGRFTEHQVHVCTFCGAMTCTHPMGDEPRGAGPVGGVSFIEILTPQVEEWLRTFPLLLTLGQESNQPIWAPADLRVQTRQELEDKTESLRAQQLRLPPPDRFLKLFKKLPAEPPATLPNFLEPYSHIAQALHDQATLAALWTRYGFER